MRALEYAIGLAKENGPIELLIVNAHEPPVIYGEIAMYMPEEKAEEMQRLHAEDILRPAIEMAKAASVAFSSTILVGNVPQFLVEYAERMGSARIVMGTRGMGAIGNLLMGSVATKVIHLTKLPVTLVK